MGLWIDSIEDQGCEIQRVLEMSEIDIWIVEMGCFTIYLVGFSNNCHEIKFKEKGEYVKEENEWRKRNVFNKNWTIWRREGNECVCLMAVLVTEGVLD